MQSVYCSTNRMCTWWCQPKFFRGPLSVLRSHTVRQDHLAHLIETAVETASVRIIKPLYLYIIVYGFLGCRLTIKRRRTLSQFASSSKHLVKTHISILSEYIRHSVFEVFLKRKNKKKNSSQTSLAA